MSLELGLVLAKKFAGMDLLLVQKYVMIKETPLAAQTHAIALITTGNVIIHPLPLSASPNVETSINTLLMKNVMITTDSIQKDAYQIAQV